MAIKNQALTITYTAWDTANQVGKVGDGANHTLKVVVDGVEQAVVGARTEVDATNAKGEYSVLLTAGNMNGDFVKFCGVSATAGIIIVPIAIAPTASVPQTGDSFALIGSGGAGLTSLATAAQANTILGYIDTEVASILADVIAVQTSVGTGLKTELDAIKAKTDQLGFTSGNVNATFTGTVVLAANGLDNVVVESGVNARQALSPILAASAGVLAGAGTSSITIAAAGNPGTNRIAAAVDGTGNRTSVTLNLPA